MLKWNFNTSEVLPHVQEILEFVPPLWFAREAGAHADPLQFGIEDRETITLYGKLLFRLHFICPSVPAALAHHALYHWSGTGRIFQHHEPCFTGSSLLERLLQTGNMICHLPDTSIIYMTITFIIWHVNCLNVCSCICPIVIFGLFLCIWTVLMWGCRLKLCVSSTHSPVHLV